VLAGLVGEPGERLLAVDAELHLDDEDEERLGGATAVELDAEIAAEGRDLADGGVAATETDSRGGGDESLAEEGAEHVRRGAEQHDEQLVGEGGHRGVG
jgi:hypothetical protein